MTEQQVVEVIADSLMGARNRLLALSWTAEAMHDTRAQTAYLEAIEEIDLVLVGRCHREVPGPKAPPPPRAAGLPETTWTARRQVLTAWGYVLGALLVTGVTILMMVKLFG